jgi:hypothetical protein
VFLPSPSRFYILFCFFLLTYPFTGGAEGRRKRGLICSKILGFNRVLVEVFDLVGCYLAPVTAAAGQRIFKALFQD